jgi:hypothetical protein
MKGIPVAPIKLNAVNRCTRSAHTRPLTSNLSNVEICASLALSAAALNLLTLSCGVSPGGPGFRCGELLLRPGRFKADAGGLADAWGVVDVKRVASVADRGILTTINMTEAEENARRIVGGGFDLHLYREIRSSKKSPDVLYDPGVFSVGMIR